MSELLLIALTAAIVSNFWLDRSARRTPSASGAAGAVGAAVWLALAVGATAATAVDRLALTPIDAAHFAPLVSLLGCVAAALVAARLPLRSRAVLRSELHVVAASAALLAIAVRHAMDTRGMGLLPAVLSAGAVFCLALTLFGGVAERLDRADVPAPLRGPALRLVAAAVLSLAFMGLSGIAGL